MSRNPHSVDDPRDGARTSPARRSSAISTIDSGVWVSKNSQLIITTGARSQAALHSISSTVIRESDVVPPGSTPR